MTPKEFEIFKLGFYAGRNSAPRFARQNHTSEDDLKFWYEQLVNPGTFLNQEYMKNKVSEK